MKELTIEEKAKAYDEVREKIAWLEKCEVVEKPVKKDVLLELGEDGEYHRVPSRKPTGVLKEMLEEIIG